MDKVNAGAIAARTINRTILELKWRLADASFAVKKAINRTILELKYKRHC